MTKKPKATEAKSPAKPEPEKADAKRAILHIGCGPKSIKDLPAAFSAGWTETRLDIDARVSPDIVADLTDMTAVADASHDAVWAGHVIEHLYHHDALTAAREMRRVLKRGGFAVVNCPDVRAVARVIAERGLDAELYVSKAGPVTARDALFGWGAALRAGNTEMAHRNGFDLASMRDLLARAGFAHVFGRRIRYDLWFLASASPCETAEADARLAEILDRKPTIQTEAAAS